MHHPRLRGPPRCGRRPGRRSRCRARGRTARTRRRRRCRGTARWPPGACRSSRCTPRAPRRIPDLPARSGRRAARRLGPRTGRWRCPPGCGVIWAPLRVRCSEFRRADVMPAAFAQRSQARLARAIVGTPEPGLSPFFARSSRSAGERDAAVGRCQLRGGAQPRWLPLPRRGQRASASPRAATTGRRAPALRRERRQGSLVQRRAGRFVPTGRRAATASTACGRTSPPT